MCHGPITEQLERALDLLFMALDLLFICHHKLSTDGLKCAYEVYSVEQRCSFAILLQSVCHGKNCSQSGAKKILRQQCGMKQQYTEQWRIFEL
jgi:hypothetical protein